MNSNTTQVGGNHYKGTTYQHWDFVILGLHGRYLEGNITKYIARWRKKNGLQDLQKARHYLNKLIELYSNGVVRPMPVMAVPPHHTAGHFCDVNGIEVSERMIILMVSNWQNRTDLHHAAKTLDALIEKEQYAEEDQRLHTTADEVVQQLAKRPDLVPLPFEATEEMKDSVCGIVGAYAAGKIWNQMRDTALFGQGPGPGYVNQG